MVIQCTVLQCAVFIQYSKQYLHLTYSHCMYSIYTVYAVTVYVLYRIYTVQ